MNNRSSLWVAGKLTVAVLLVGFSASGQIGPLLDPGWLGRFAGVWVLFLSLVVAVATIQNYRTNP